MAEINTLTSSHKHVQQRLAELADKPEGLYYIGTVFSHDAPAIGIVGSRKPTAYGQEMTHRLAYDLAKKGVVIISGLALGVDGIAHRAALEAGGTTIAVLAGGLDDIYPYRHRPLARQIVENGGALMSEYPTGTPSLPHQFIARNRLIAAMSEGTLITEAAAKSGSLHTAQFALDLGRPVMAVPGLATNPMASGCLNLLKAGAAMVTQAAEALFTLGYQPASTAQQLMFTAGSPEEASILRLLSEGIRQGEELLARSRLSAAKFNQTLSMLELAGKIKPLGGNCWMLVAQ